MHFMNLYKRKETNIVKLICIILAFLIVILMLVGVSLIVNSGQNEKLNNADKGNYENNQQILIEYPTEIFMPEINYPDNTDDIKKFGEDIASKSGVLINVTDNKIVAGLNEKKVIYPASMTKVMTLIIVVENMDSLDDTFTMTHDILAPLYDADASTAGFQEGETITIEDMIYGAVLPSGADATVGLAIALCGSEENFVNLMNEKVEMMGLENTHFTNTSGLHDKNHYTTPVEMAMIMEYAMQNEICREVLSTYQYTTSKTPKHPEGIELSSTMFSRMYGDEVEGAVIEGGKTGYTDEAENCLVTFGTKGGKEYVTVTSLSYDYWMTIHDVFNIYANYIEPKSEINIVAE